MFKVSFKLAYSSRTERNFSRVIDIYKGRSYSTEFKTTIYYFVAFGKGLRSFPHVLHCVYLQRVISRAISARVLKN